MQNLIKIIIIIFGVIKLKYIQKFINNSNNIIQYHNNFKRE